MDYGSLGETGFFTEETPLAPSSPYSASKTAADLLVGVEERVFPVGRLDMDTEGLLIFTNDGDLANYLTHPRYGVPKTYLALIRGAVQDSDLEKLRGGLYFEEGKVKVRTVAEHLLVCFFLGLPVAGVLVNEVKRDGFFF